MLGESKKEYRKGTVLEVKKDGVWGYGQLSGETTITNGQALELGNPDTIRIRMQESS